MGKSNKAQNSSKLENKLDRLIDTIEKNEIKASARHKDITKRLKNIEYEVEMCKKKDRSMSNEIVKLKASINTLEQAQLENHINIRGIPETEENPNQLFDAIFSLIKAVIPSFTSQYLLKVNRIGKQKEGFSRPVVVQLSNKSAKDALIGSAKSAPLDCSLITVNGKVWGTRDDKIYLGHHLTRENSIIFYEARKLRKKGTVKYAWIKDGHVLIKKTDTSKAVYLNRVEDIQTFLGNRKSKIFNSTKKDTSQSESILDDPGSSDSSNESEEEISENDDDDDEFEEPRNNKRKEGKRAATSPASTGQPLRQRPKRTLTNK